MLLPHEDIDIYDSRDRGAYDERDRQSDMMPCRRADADFFAAAAMMLAFSPRIRCDTLFHYCYIAIDADASRQPRQRRHA